MKTRRLKVWLGERVAVADVRGARVDREAGVIRGVKILGYESKNGRRYLREAVKAAAPLYEGVSVRVDHPRRATDQRETDEVLGWLRGVEARDDGLYGDLHYLKSHPLADRLCEAAERNPSLYGLSHNADGSTETRGGETVVLEITEVRSVDLVADPATVGGLFEGHRRMATKLKAFLESVKLVKLPAKKQKAGRRLIARLFEAGMMDPAADAPMDEAPAEDAPPADHEEALRGGFEAACHALATKALSGEMDEGEAIKKFKELISSHGKLTSKPKPAPVEEEDDSDDDEEVTEGEDEELEECDDEDDMKESKVLRRRLKQLEAKEEVRELCESKGYSPSKAMLGALVAARKEDREAIIDEARAAQPRRPRNQPLSEGKTGTGTTKDIKDGKGFAASLRNGAFSNN